MLFGAFFCILQPWWQGRLESDHHPVRDNGPPVGARMFFLCDLLIGLLVQRLLMGSSGGWHNNLKVAVALATPPSVWFSLVGVLLGPPVILIGTLIPYLLVVGILCVYPCLLVAPSKTTPR